MPLPHGPPPLPMHVMTPGPAPPLLMGSSSALTNGHHHPSMAGMSRPSYAHTMGQTQNQLPNLGNGSSGPPVQVPGNRGTPVASAGSHHSSNSIMSHMPNSADGPLLNGAIQPAVGSVVAPPASALKSLQMLAQTNESTWLQIGALAELMQDFDRAINAYEACLRHNPYCVAALTQLAGICRAREQFSRAVEYFQRILAISADNGEIWGALGHCWLMMDDLQQAYSAYQQALYLLPNPKEPRLWYGIAILYDRYGSLDHAEEAFSSVIRMDPNIEKANEIYFRLGIIYKQQRKFSNALDCFQYILNNPPRPLTEIDIHFQIGHVYEQQKDYERARQAYERVLEDNSNHAKVLQQLGWLYHQPQAPFCNQETAVNYLSKSIESESSDPQTWYLLGRVYITSQKYSKAYESYQQAVYRDGRNPTFWCSIGVLYYQIGQYRDALDAYSRAIKLNPYIAETWNNLGNLYETCNGQIADAIDAYTKAAELDPGNEAIQQRLRIVCQQQANGGHVAQNAQSLPNPQDINLNTYQSNLGRQPPSLLPEGMLSRRRLSADSSDHNEPSYRALSGLTLPDHSRELPGIHMDRAESDSHQSLSPDGRRRSPAFLAGPLVPPNDLSSYREPGLDTSIPDQGDRQRATMPPIRPPPISDRDDPYLANQYHDHSRLPLPLQGSLDRTQGSGGLLSTPVRPPGSPFLSEADSVRAKVAGQYVLPKIENSDHEPSPRHQKDDSEDATREHEHNRARDRKFHNRPWDNSQDRMLRANQADPRKEIPPASQRPYGTVPHSRAPSQSRTEPEPSGTKAKGEKQNVSKSLSESAPDRGGVELAERKRRKDNKTPRTDGAKESTFLEVHSGSTPIAPPTETAYEHSEAIAQISSKGESISQSEPQIGETKDEVEGSGIGDTGEHAATDSPAPPAAFSRSALDNAALTVANSASLDGGRPGSERSAQHNLSAPEDTLSSTQENTAISIEQASGAPSRKRDLDDPSTAENAKRQKPLDAETTVIRSMSPSLETQVTDQTVEGPKAQAPPAVAASLAASTQSKEDLNAVKDTRSVIEDAQASGAHTIASSALNGTSV